MPYTPGEQPKEQQYIKLNTNENAYAPPAGAARYLQSALEHAQLYPDPECTALRRKMAALTGLQEDEIIFTNGSDEILNFAFMAFCDADTGAASGSAPAVKKYRCKICKAEFEAVDGEEAICPLCKATGADLEEI